MSCRHWLMKSEPDVYGFDDLERDGVTPWEGVRNYQARNFMQEQRVGDGVLFYHSNANPPGIVGVARIANVAYPDPSQFNPASDYFDPKATPDKPRWFMTDVAFVRRFARLVSLHELRQVPALHTMVLLNNSRLSVQPVTVEEWRLILQLGGLDLKEA